MKQKARKPKHSFDIKRKKLSGWKFSGYFLKREQAAEFFKARNKFVENWPIFSWYRCYAPRSTLVDPINLYSNNVEPKLTLELWLGLQDSTPV